MSQAQKQAQQQKKTFQRLINDSLAKSAYPTIEDLVEDVTDGFYLINFINSLGDKKRGKKKTGTFLIAPEPKPQNVYACLSNLNAVLKHLKDEGVAIVNISSEDLKQKNEKLVLALIWNIIIHFATDGQGSQLSKELLKKLNEILAQHHPQFGVGPVSKFTDDSVRDGTVFEVLNSHFTDEKDKEKLKDFKKKPDNAAANFDDALNQGNDLLGITKLLDGEDMNGDAVPDDKSVMTQVLQYMNLLGQQNQQQFLKDQLNRRLEDSLNSKKKANEIKKRSDDLIKWINKTNEEMSDRPEDIHPDELQKKKEYKDNHFDHVRKPKSDEYNAIVSDAMKLRQENAAKNLSPPVTGVSTLTGAWKGLMHTESANIQYIESKLKAYQLVATREQAFLRKLRSCNDASDKIASDAEEISTKSKTADLSNIDALKINQESNEQKVADTTEGMENLTQFTNEKIKSVCPSASYFNERFQTPLNKGESHIGESKAKSAKAKNDLDEAEKKLDKVRENLKKIYQNIQSLQANLNNSKLLLEENPQFKQLDELEDYCDELNSIKFDKMKAKLDDCDKRDAENTSMAGSPVPNPYTSVKSEDLKNDYNKISADADNKKNSLVDERARLEALKKKSADLEARADHINKQLDDINDKISSVNDEKSDDTEKAIKALDDLSTLLNAVSPAITTLKNDASDVPELASQCNQLISRCDETQSAVNEQAHILSNKPSADSSKDMELTEEEIKSITKNFNENDTERTKHLNQEQFKSMVVTKPPLGMNTANVQQEVVNFFLTYSSNRESLSLQDVLKGYGEFKASFVLKSKDAVLKMLTSKADADGMVSEADLKSTVSASIFAQIQEAVGAIEKNGSKHYHINDLV